MRPQTLAEYEVADLAEWKWPTLKPEDWTALPDSEVERDLHGSFAAARVVAAVMLLLALADLPYSFYQVLRLIVTVAVGHR